MNRTTQQIPSNPALDFANSILEVTNNGLELIEILRDIAEDTDEVATTNDRIAATNILNDRVFGRSPRHISPSAGQNPDPAPDTDDNDAEAIRESPSTISQKEPDSPRLVTQIDDSLNESLGPAPSAHTSQPVEPAPYSIRGAGLVPAQPTFDPNSIHFIVQQHILDITNNGQMMRDILLEIARAEDDPKACPEQRRRIKPSHRRRAATLLLDRVLGTDPNALRNGVCPDCRQRWTTHPGSHAHPESGHVANPVLLDDDEIEAAKPETWDKVIAELKRLEDEGARTPGPPGPEIDYSAYMPPDDFDLTPYLEQAEAFKAKVALRIERQKNWPKIEERRRKKLAQIYPSHSDDQNDPPDT